MSCLTFRVRLLTDHQGHTPVFGSPVLSLPSRTEILAFGSTSHAQRQIIHKIGRSSTNIYGIVVYAGKDASRAMAISSLNPEDCTADILDLEEQHKTVLEEWLNFFLHRYRRVGRVSSML